MTGNELRAIRAQLNMTQQVLADVLGLKAQTISDLERGKMHISKSVENHILVLLKLGEIKKVLEGP